MKGETFFYIIILAVIGIGGYYLITTITTQNQLALQQSQAAYQAQLAAEQAAAAKQAGSGSNNGSLLGILSLFGL